MKTGIGVYKCAVQMFENIAKTVQLLRQSYYVFTGARINK